MSRLQSLLTAAVGFALLALVCLTRQPGVPSVLAAQSEATAAERVEPEYRATSGLQVLYDFRTAEGA